jgi:transforming growth factor-beta-induced protein
MKILKQLPSLFFMLALSVSFIACESDDVDDDVKANNDITIGAFIAGDDNFSMLAEALDRTNLTSVLNDGDEEYTLFAPNNAAFEKLGMDLSAISDEDLTNILLYHVHSGDRIGVGNLTFEDRYFETAATAGPNGENLSIMLERDDDVLRVNGMMAVSSTPNDFENGAIYEINDVLTLPTIASIVLADESLSNLGSALTTASGDLDKLLSGTDVFTVFAPRNEAFDDISETTSGLSADELASVLTYHVVPGNIRKDDLSDDQVVTTANGETFIIDIDLGVVRIEDSTGDKTLVFLTDIQTTNGVVHLINDVLMPNEL